MKNTGGRPIGSRAADLTRARIQTTKLVDRLQECGLGKVEISTQQLKAIQILLNKTLPDLSSVELTGNPENPVAYQQIERRIVRANATD